MIVNRYHAKGTLDQVLKPFREAASRDVTAERATTWGSRASAVLLVGAMLVGVIGMQTGHTVPCFVSVALIVLAIVARVWSLFEGRHDLDDRKLDAVVRLLGFLRTDIRRRDPMDLAIDFRAYQDANPSAAAIAGGKWPQAHLYRHEWLTLAARLADGNRLRMRVTDLVKRKEKRRYKYTKVSESTTSRIQVVLKLRPRYGGCERLARRLESGATPCDLELRKVSVKGRSLRISLKTQRTTRRVTRSAVLEGVPSYLVTSDTLLSTLAWIYRAIGQQRQAS